MCLIHASSPHGQPVDNLWGCVCFTHQGSSDLFRAVSKCSYHGCVCFRSQSSFVAHVMSVYVFPFGAFNLQFMENVWVVNTFVF